MSQNFGMAMPARPAGLPHRTPVRYLVVIEAGGAAVARLLLASREQVNELDAAAAEVANAIAGLTPVQGALGPEWDQALRAHSLQERAGAQVYTLPA